MPMDSKAIIRSSKGRFAGAQLTPMQREFAYQYVINGGNGSKAAEAAGYANPPQDAHRNLRLPHVQHEIFLCRQRYLGDLATKALPVVKGILEDDEAPGKLRLEAAKMVLHQAGHVAPKAPEAAGEQDERPMSEWTTDELAEFIEQGKQALAIAQQPTLEGEATEVRDAGCEAPEAGEAPKALE